MEVENGRWRQRRSRMRCMGNPSHGGGAFLLKCFRCTTNGKHPVLQALCLLQAFWDGPDLMESRGYSWIRNSSTSLRILYADYDAGEIRWSSIPYVGLMDGCPPSLEDRVQSPLRTCGKTRRGTRRVTTGRQTRRSVTGYFLSMHGNRNYHN